MSAVTDYIEKLSPQEKTVFGHLRDLVHEVVPDAEDAYSYGLPTYKYKGKYLLAFASNKKFLSIYPGGYAIDAVGGELKKFATGRGTLSFTPDNQIPDESLLLVIKFCKDWIDENRKSY